MKTFSHVCQHLKDETFANLRVYANANQDRIIVGKSPTGAMQLLCCEQCEKIVRETQEQNSKGGKQ